MRNAFADELTKLGETDERIVLLSGDIGNKLFDKFKSVAPSRFFNCGVAEGNMMGVAAGMGLNGLRPVVYTIAPFTTTRCFEQIRVDVCYHEAPVIIVGTGAGLSYSQLGPTHHSLEDIAIMRTLPGMTVFCPCDSMELRSGLRAALNHNGPVYIRIGKKGEAVFHDTSPDIELGTSITLSEGRDVCILSTGNIMNVVKETARLLEEIGISVRVESVHTVKPIDQSMLRSVFSKFKLVAIAEEHSEIGGLTSAVSEWLLNHRDVRPEIISACAGDSFIHRVGTQSQTREGLGLTSDLFCRKITDAWESL